MTNTISKIIHNGDEFEFDTSSVSGITTTQPSNPVEGAMYYDTTNDVVKVYDGTNWNVVGDDAANINTKTFYLSSTSDLTNAQAAYDWYKAGKNPIIRISGWNYSFILEGNNSEPTYHLGFYGVKGRVYNGTSNSSIGINPRLELRRSSNTVTSVVVTSYNANTLFTDVDYSTPYTPTYPGSPATKKYVDDSVSGAISAGTTTPSNPVEGQLWYDTTNDVLKVYDGTNWVEVGKEYNAGEGISIGNVTKNGRQGPSPEGFHVPSKYEWKAIYNILTSTFLLDGNRDTVQTYLKLPFAGYRSRVTGNFNSGEGAYWSYSPSATDGNSINFDFGINYLHWQTIERRATGLPIRAFKDISISPDNNWTTLYDGSSVASGAGIFWNSTDGLISVSGDGTTWYTIMDKNLGATTVYNSGDTLTDANCGYFYQWGNNYGFPHSGTVTTSSTKVDASSYGPTNPYSSDTFIIGNDDDWSSVHNDDLWGNATGTYTLDNAITNTGVLSVNGQTGDVTIQNESNVRVFEMETNIITVGGDFTGNDLNTIIEIKNWLDENEDRIAYAKYGATMMFVENRPGPSVGIFNLYAYHITPYYGGDYILISLIHGTKDPGYPEMNSASAQVREDLFFTPGNSGMAGQVLTKTSGNYEWKTPTEPTVVSGDSGTTYTIKVSNSAPASGTPNSTITFVI